MVSWQAARRDIVKDDRGRRLVDFTSGVMVANVGHAHPQVLTAIRKVSNKPLLHCYKYDYDEKNTLRRMLCDLSGFARVEFSVTGAEAVEISLRLALRHGALKGRSAMGAFKNAFHGKTLGAAALSDIDRYKRPYSRWSSSQVLRFTFPDDSAVAGSVLNEISSSAERLAAIFLEPIQGSTLQELDPGFGQNLSDLCARKGIFLVVDEIQTGMYRTGSSVAYTQHGLRPDIVLLGKGLTSSLPLCALLMTDAAAAFFEPEDGSTHVANPLAVAAAIACLNVYDSPHFRDQIASSARAYDAMLSGLRTTLSRQRARAIVAGGLYGGIAFMPNGTGREMADRFQQQALDEGYLLSGGVGNERNLIKLTPPLSIPSGTLREAGLKFKRLLEAW